MVEAEQRWTQWQGLDDSEQTKRLKKEKLEWTKQIQLQKWVNGANPRGVIDKKYGQCPRFSLEGRGPSLYNVRRSIENTEYTLISKVQWLLDWLKNYEDEQI